MNEIAKYMKEHNLMFPIHGMTMGGKVLVYKNEDGSDAGFMPIPDETEENRAIYNSYLKQLQEDEYKLMWGTIN